MVKGFADVHNHQFAQHAFGGRMFWGTAYGDITSALGHCHPVHGPGGAADLLGNWVRTVNEGLPALSGFGHLVGGYPQFDGWPRWDSYTHQSVFEDWLKRAVDGGLRLMVMLAVNSQALCDKIDKRQGRTCNDMEAVDLQLDEARRMQAHVDRKAGGPGQGWYRLVGTPDQARTVVMEGKLAVVLGIEVDYLFNAHKGTRLTAAQLRRELDKYYERGVRHIFPIHFDDNGFGGASFDKVLQKAQFDVLAPLAQYSLEVEPASQYSYRGGHRNARGLTPLGKTLIHEAIARGMIIEVDHMSARSRADTLDICERLGYPVVSGHTGFVEISKGDKRHEGNLLPAEVERIRKLRGMVSVIPFQGKIDQIGTYRAGRGATTVDHISGASSNTTVQGYLYAVSKMRSAPVGIGTDFNGFAGLPRPRFGADSAGQLRAGALPPTNPCPYPFVAAASGKRMSQSKIGTKVFDINRDGLAHVGMLPDLIADFKAMGLTDDDLAPLLHSAEGYVALWQRARARSFGRVGVLHNDGTVHVKEGPLDATWTYESNEVTQLVLESDRIGVLHTDGTVHVKEGPLDATWTYESNEVTQLVLEGDRIGVLHTDGTVHVKEGPLDATWTYESSEVTQLVLEGDRIGVLHTDGTVHVKEGGLGAAWTLETGDAAQLVLEGDRIGVLHTDGTVHVKEGPLDATWTYESNEVTQLVLEGDRIGVLHTDGNVHVKEGGLGAAWSWESSEVKQLVLEGDRIGVLLNDGAVHVKEGWLDSAWTLVASDCRVMDLRTP